MAQAALASKEAGTVGGVRPRVVVRVNLADLISHPGHPDHHRLPGRLRSVSPPTIDWVGPIGQRLLMQLLDDCEIARIVFGPDGQLLDIGRATRVWPVGMRRAIVERDRGCRFPTCDRRPEWCDVDHILPWEVDGPTAVWNGLLLCRHHHRAKRRDGWWPTLHTDGTVTWTHADGRTRTRRDRRPRPHPPQRHRRSQPQRRPSRRGRVPLRPVTQRHRPWPDRGERNAGRLPAQPRTTQPTPPNHRARPPPTPQPNRSRARLNPTPTIHARGGHAEHQEHRRPACTRTAARGRLGVHIDRHGCPALFKPIDRDERFDLPLASDCQLAAGEHPVTWRDERR
jgi:hypothetical protein